MSRESDAGRVMANAVELGTSIMEKVECDDLVAPRVSVDQAQEELATKILNRLTERAGV